MTYTLQDEIGRGGYGIVYRASGDDGRLYAVKKLNVGIFPGRERSIAIRRFEREVRYQDAINHPNVVKIIEHNLDDDPPWFVMPLAIGSLMDDIEADRTLGGDPQKPLFDILAGLEELHDKGFSHRDLKPANVLKFRCTGGDTIYKISDFGLTTPGMGRTTTLTASNMAGGTVNYRAPECANNFRRATAQADIYSIGAILHDIFHGGPRIPHSQLTVTGVVADILEKCTAPNSRRRYRSISKLREDLFRVLESEDIEFESKEEEEIIDLIVSQNDLADDQWDRIFDVIDTNEDNGVSNYNIMRSISGKQIESLYDISPDMFHGLGVCYAKFATAYSFAFEYCDIVSDKGDIFYKHGDIQLRAKIALAMLEMGASHNRWRVERQFMQMVRPEIDDALAARIKIEIQVQDLNFVRLMKQIERSIPVRCDEIHPILRDML